MSISLCGNTAFYQWDVNQRLRVSVDAGTELHFANADTENALVLLAYEEDGKVFVDVPNILLQTAGSFTMYYYLIDGDERHTSRAIVFDVLPRKRPDTYVYTETEVLRWEEVSAAALAEVQDVLNELRLAIQNGTAGITVGHGLKYVNGELCVDTAEAVEQDNTLPVTSAAVYVELGNVEALLQNI